MPENSTYFLEDKPKTKLCSEHKDLVEMLNNINENVNEIKDVLCGGISDGEYKEGIFEKLKAVKKTQLIINSILITVVAGTIVVIIANNIIG